MDPRFSIFLDFLRFAAAALVFIGHFSHQRFTGEMLSFVRGIEHDAVMIFFVMSGYVISYVARFKDLSCTKYFISRLSRFHSVVIPAIIITIVADQVGMAVNETLYVGVYSDSFPALRIISNLLFAQEFWGAGLRLFSNGPFWSLSYEFSYYIIFAFFFFYRGWKRVAGVLVCIVVVGPNILLLAPVWFLGVLAERTTATIPRFLSILVSVLLPVLFVFYKIQVQPALPVFNEFSWSKNFVHAYFLGLFIALEIIFIRSLFDSISYKPTSYQWIENIIRSLASYTFSLYLYHFPLLMMFYAVLSPIEGSWISHIFIVSIVAFIIKIVGDQTEKKKSLVVSFYSKIAKVSRSR